MPLGAPSHTVPKSGCTRFVAPPQLLISVVEFGSTGCAEMSVFHGLSAGNTRRDPTVPPPPVLPPVPPPPFRPSTASVSAPGDIAASPAQAVPNVITLARAAIVASRRIAYSGRGLVHSDSPR